MNTGETVSCPAVQPIEAQLHLSCALAQLQPKLTAHGSEQRVSNRNLPTMPLGVTVAPQTLTPWAGERGVGGLRASICSKLPGGADAAGHLGGLSAPPSRGCCSREAPGGQPG